MCDEESEYLSFKSFWSHLTTTGFKTKEWRAIHLFNMTRVKGVQPIFFVKLDFEIADNQKRGTYDRILSGFLTPSAK